MSQREMKGELKELYEGIRQDLVRLHGNWQIYRQLFATDDERYVTMNDTAPGFFRFIQDMLVDNAVISLGRLTDPKGHESLSTLVRSAKNQVHHSLYDDLKKDLSSLIANSQDVLEHRHRRVAHKERTGSAPAFEDPPAKLPPLTRKLIEGAMSDMASLMNKLLAGFTGDYQVYEPVVTGDAEGLLYFLAKGLEASRLPN